MRRKGREGRKERTVGQPVSAMYILGLLAVAAQTLTSNSVKNVLTQAAEPESARERERGGSGQVEMDARGHRRRIKMDDERRTFSRDAAEPRMNVGHDVAQVGSRAELRRDGRASIRRPELNIRETSGVQGGCSKEIGAMSSVLVVNRAEEDGQAYLGWWRCWR